MINAVRLTSCMGAYDGNAGQLLCPYILSFSRLLSYFALTLRIYAYKVSQLLIRSIPINSTLVQHKYMRRAVKSAASALQQVKSAQLLILP